MADKKFLLISNMYPNADNPGFGSFVRNVCEGMKPFGIRMTDMAVIRGRGKTLCQKICKYIGFYTAICCKFFKCHDFVYIHFPNQTVPLLKLLYVFKKPVTVVNYHGEDLLYSDSGLGNRLGRLTEDFCRHHATRIVVPSQYYKDIVVEKGIADASKVIVSPSGGINPEIFFTNPERRILKDGILRLGYVGRLDPGKGIMEFLGACRLLRDRSIPFEAQVIGYGSLKDEAMAYIAANGLGEYITHIEGLPQKELGVRYREFDLLVFLSGRKSESLGLTGIEAMACGTPVIGSSVGGIRSYLRHGENGYIAASCSPEEAADAIERFIHLSEEERTAMSRRCSETGARYYAPEVCRTLANQFSEL